MKKEELSPPTLYFLRALAVLFLSLIATVVVIVIMGLIGDLGFISGLFYMRSEAALLGALPFMGAVLAAVIVKIMGSKKAALRVFYTALIAFFAFVGITTVFETLNTKPIVAAASTFKELPGLTREMENNGDKFSPAPSGFIPCIDIMGEGCPNITRTWLAAPDRELTVADLQKVLDNSGWKDVKIKTNECDTYGLKNESYHYCVAEGMVGDYKATVRIDKINVWELEMYLRLPTNVR